MRNKVAITSEAWLILVLNGGKNIKNFPKLLTATGVLLKKNKIINSVIPTELQLDLAGNE